MCGKSHRPAQASNPRPPGKSHARVTRWYLELQSFKFCIRHKTGKENIAADFLSGLPNFAVEGEEGSNVTKARH